MELNLNTPIRIKRNENAGWENNNGEYELEYFIIDADGYVIGSANFCDDEMPKKIEEAVNIYGRVKSYPCLDLIMDAEVKPEGG